MTTTIQNQYNDSESTRQALKLPPNTNIVFFTNESDNVIDGNIEGLPPSLQITCLPIEYNTEDKLKTLFETVLYIGKVTDIRIIEKQIYNQRLDAYITTKTAFIDFSIWNKTNNTLNLYGLLESERIQHKCNITTIVPGELHWENGERMTHMTLREAQVDSGKGKYISELTNLQNESLTLSEDEWNSLYIPILPTFLYIQQGNNEQTRRSFQPRYLKSFIEQDLKLGKVRRVDFIDRELPDKQLVKSVFIHFESWYNNSNVTYLRDKLNTQGSFKQRGYYDGVNNYKFMCKNDNGDIIPGHFIFKINHKPIPDVVETELNMSQLVAANKVLEEKIIEKDELLAEKDEIIAKLNEQLNNQ